MRDGSKVRVTAQLIDGASDKHVWANSFQRDVKDVLALQSEVAQTIARAVGARLTPQGEARLAKAVRPVLPAAYDAYVRGRHEWNKRKVPNLREAIKIFQESIDADPTYAPAYAGMADCYAALGYSSVVSPEDSFPRAKAAAEKALELDPDLAEAHASLGYALMYYDWNFPLAEKEYRKAIELNPSNALGHQWYAYLLMATGRPRESLAQVDVAKRLDPLSVPIHTDQAYMLYYDRQTAAALKEVEMALEMDPKFPIGHFWLGRIYTSQGKFVEAEAEFQKIGDLRAWTPAMAAMGFLYGKWGKPEKAGRSWRSSRRSRRKASTRRATPSRSSMRASGTRNEPWPTSTRPTRSALTGSCGSTTIRAGTSSAPSRVSRSSCARSVCRFPDSARTGPLTLRTTRPSPREPTPRSARPRSSRRRRRRERSSKSGRAR